MSGYEKAEGVVHLYVDIKVDVSEMRHWPPSVIERFFAGIAMAQAAVNQSQRFRPVSKTGRPVCAHGKGDQEPCEECGTRFVWPA